MDAASELAGHIRRIGLDRPGPILVALDGRSAAGKSTLAGEVAPLVGAVVIDGDDFYSGGTAETWDAMNAAEKANHCVDWRRQRPVLEKLASGLPATWHPYDWEADDGGLTLTSVVCDPAPVIILDGAYSARPELADLFDLRVLLDAPATLRRAQLIEREGEGYREEWNARWDEAEQWYFGNVMPPESFDLVIEAT
ncbi:MAG: uridine kinase family protein [Acidimicrobiia bacterium]